ncbi:hypothetical protein LV157_005211 [Aspergillus fumigatus]|nr:hypothetical protein LV157_005211 [Aspergillus fumigatus]
MPPSLTKQITQIEGVRLAGANDIEWDITINYPGKSAKGTIVAITPHRSSSPNDNCSPLALPALTHPHIHLDKAYVHSTREYAHLLPAEGSFQEALSFTAQAKKQFSQADLMKRGEWLLAESVSAGVTAMRAFVEVDHTVKLTCLETGLKLKDEWKECCNVQIVCFAQDPIFSGEYGDENRDLIEKALERYPQIDVIGTTPYVESSTDAARRNIGWAIETAVKLDKHADFHLDYSLDSSKEALVCFVGLPTSDMYMASPYPAANAPHNRPRGTLHVLKMISEHGLDAIIGVNNVGNAFTPWGSADPLSLACLGVGIYQAGTQKDAELLYECVSTRARAAIGLLGSQGGSSLMLKEGDQPDLVVLHNVDDTGCNVLRPRNSVADVVWDPPARVSRHIISNGRLKLPPHPMYPGTARYAFKDSDA